MVITSIRRLLTIAATLLMLGASSQAQALNYQPPIMDELTSPFTESEAGGIGCITSSVLMGSGMIYLLGGLGPFLSTLATPMPPVRVLEGSAAAAFVFSSACYIGVALAPLAMVTFTAIADSFAQMPTNNHPVPVTNSANSSSVLH